MGTVVYYGIQNKDKKMEGKFTKENVTVNMLENSITDLRNLTDKHILLKNRQTEYWNNEIIPLQEKIHLMLDVLEKSKYKVEGVGTFYVETVEGFTLPKNPADRERFFKYLKKTGQYKIYITVPAPTVNSICAGAVKHAEMKNKYDWLPPGIVRKEITIRYKLNKG